MTNKNYLSKTITLLVATIFSISSFAQNNEPMFEEIIVTAEKEARVFKTYLKRVTVLSGIDLDNDRSPHL